MLRKIYTASAIFSIHSAVIIYINSSFLGEYFNDAQLSLLYILGAILNISFLFALPKIIARFGIHTCTLALLAIDLIATLGLVVDGTASLVAISFTLHQTSTLLIALMFDEYLEHTLKTEEFTGRVRSVYMTISNIALVISPSITGALVAGVYGFRAAYCVSLALIIPLFLIVWRKMKYENGHRPYVGIRQAIKIALSNESSSSIVICRFILEFFYAWMVIYMSLYLTKSIGFGWEQIGIMFTIMLLPFVFFEIPLGTLSDKFIGEKEIILFGFIVMAGATAIVPFITLPSFFIWASVLFMTRVGASFTEIGTESFFFKNVKGEDTGMISLFRATRPFAYIVAPAAATLSFSLLSRGNAFFVLSAVVLCGTWFALMLKDTK